MTQLLFDELPIGAQISIGTLDRGVLSGQAVPSSAPSGLLTTLGSFNTIATGALGSGRLNDVPLATLQNLATGALAYVKSVKAFFRWDPLGNDVNDNITIATPIAVGVGIGRFYRVLVPSIEWQIQALGWGVDATNGSDENTGLFPAAPLKTFAEYRRRIGDRILANQTVTINGNLGATDVLDLELLDTGTFFLTIQGQTTVALDAQTIGTYVARNAGTNVPNQLTPTANITWANFVGNGFFVAPTSGAAVGKRASVLVDTGGGPPSTARMATFINAASAETQPANADTFQILACPTVTNTKFGTWSTGIQLLFLNFVTNQVIINCGPNTSLATPQPSNNLQFSFCCFTEPPVVRGDPSFVGCQCMKSSSGGKFSLFGQGRVRANGCAFYDPGNAAFIFDEGCLMTCSNGTTFQGTSVSCFASSPNFNNAAFFDTVTTAISAKRGSVIVANTLYGNTGAGNPFACTLQRSDHVVQTGAGQTLTNGGGNEIAMPLTASTTWAAVRAAGGVKDGATSDASAMVET